MPGSAAGQDVVADHLPAGRAQRQRRLAERVRHGPQRLLGGDDDHRQDQETQRQPAGPERRAQCQARHAEGPHEQRQAEDAVDDRRHAGEVGDVRLDDPPEPARRGVLLEEDRRADADRDGEDGHQAEQPETAGDPDPEPGQRRVARAMLRHQRVKEVEQVAGVTRHVVPGVRPERCSTMAMTDPSSTESTTTPVSVARKQAAPKSGPASTPEPAMRLEEGGFRPAH